MLPTKISLLWNEPNTCVVSKIQKRPLLFSVETQWDELSKILQIEKNFLFFKVIFCMKVPTLNYWANTRLIASLIYFQPTVFYGETI